MWGWFCNLKKLHKLKNRSFGKNSFNFITLVITHMANEPITFLLQDFRLNYININYINCYRLSSLDRTYEIFYAYHLVMYKGYVPTFFIKKPFQVMVQFLKVYTRNNYFLSF
jgi:hypothetical protein